MLLVPVTTGESIPLRGSVGVPGLPGAPQDEAGLTRKFEMSHVGAGQAVAGLVLAVFGGRAGVSRLDGESQGQGSLMGCHLWGCTESDTTERLSP